jgi:Resolvase, N terminal domain
MFVRAYLRASTDEQDASRARQQLETFAAERGLSVAAWYAENESGAKLARPELFRLLADARPGDVLLVEQVDRLSRLTTSDWERLKAEIAKRRVRVIALDLPTSWTLAKEGDAFTARMLDALNGMMLDMRQRQPREWLRDGGSSFGEPCLDEPFAEKLAILCPLQQKALQQKAFSKKGLSREVWPQPQNGRHLGLCLHALTLLSVACRQPGMTPWSWVWPARKRLGCLSETPQRIQGDTVAMVIPGRVVRV